FSFPCFLFFFFFYCFDDHRDLHSFPTRRSSDLASSTRPSRTSAIEAGVAQWVTMSRGRNSSRTRSTSGGPCAMWTISGSCARSADRKSTRLNSSHDQISYAVFCLKKKKKKTKKN